MSLPQAEHGLIRDKSPHSTCSNEQHRKQRSFFASILSNALKLSETKLQYNSDGENKSRNFLSAEKRFIERRAQRLKNVQRTLQQENSTGVGKANQTYD